MTDVVATLIAISRPPRPAKWTATYEPLAAKYEGAQAALDAFCSSAGPLADDLAMINVTALVPHIVPDAMPHVGQLVHAGRDLRAALDSNFVDLRDSLRSARSATKESDFTSAIEKAQTLLPRVEGTVVEIARLVDKIHALILKLSATTFVSSSLVIPKRPSEPMISA